MGINIKAKTALYFSLVSNFLIIILFVIVPKVSAATGCFPDTNGHWAETFICWLSDNGIAGGYPDGTFRPENGVTRAELSVFLSNFNDNIGHRWWQWGLLYPGRSGCPSGWFLHPVSSGCYAGCANKPDS